MTHIIFLILFAMATTAIAQYDSLRFYHQGDVLVFSEDGTQISTMMRFPLGYGISADAAPGEMVEGISNSGSKVAVDSNGFVTTGYNGQDRLAYFPLPPIKWKTVEYAYNTDTVVITLTRQFDTTLFHISVTAYDLHFYWRGRNGIDTTNYYRNVLSVADSFGLIRWQGASLYNAIIRGARFVNAYRFTFAPLCAGNYSRSSYHSPYGSGESGCFVEYDTLINGTTYYKVLGDLGSWINGFIGGKLYRSDSIGFYMLQDDESELLLRYNAVWLGQHDFNFTDWSFVNEIQTYPDETWRCKEFTLWNAEGIWPFDAKCVFVDSIGPYSWYIHDEWYGTSSGSFTGAKLCGHGYGSVGIPDVHQPPAFFTLGQNYPNPVSLSAPVTNISVAATHGGPTQLVLTDMLGREVRRVEVVPGQATVALNVQGLLPGVYWYRIGNVLATEAQKLVIVP